MESIYDEVLNELNSRNIAHVDIYPPFYICSVGAHMLNLVNNRKKIWTEGGLATNTRLHILLVTPPGFGKSFWLRQFMKGDTSILAGSGVLTTFEGLLSEAGLVGTIKFDDKGKEVKKEGLCEEESTSIIGIEEFAGITKAFQANYNTGLDNALLTALDTGDVIKRLAAGPIKTHTDFTMWTGTQPARYDMASGLARRFIFLFFVPNSEDIQEFKIKRRQALNVRSNYANLKELKTAIRARFQEIRNDLTGIEIDKTFYDLMDNFGIIHYEEPLYERIAIGYWLMKSKKVRGVLNVTVDTELRRLIKLQFTYRNQLKRGAELAQVWQLIQKEKKMPESMLIGRLLDFSMDYEDAKKIIVKLIGLKWIKKARDNAGKYTGDIEVIRGVKNTDYKAIAATAAETEDEEFMH